MDFGSKEYLDMLRKVKEQGEIDRKKKEEKKKRREESYEKKEV